MDRKMRFKKNILKPIDEYLNNVKYHHFLNFFFFFKPSISGFFYNLEVDLGTAPKIRIKHSIGTKIHACCKYLSMDELLTLTFEITMLL